MTETNTVRALIFPAKNGYNAICLDLCAVVKEQSTKEEAAKAITRSIDEWVHEGIERHISFVKMRRTALEVYQKAYASNQSHPYAPTFNQKNVLRSEVQELVKIKYKYYPYPIRHQ